MSDVAAYHVFVCALFLVQGGIPFMKPAEKYGRCRNAADNNIIGMLDNRGYRHTLRVCNSY
jgi:hypothetical protein